MASIAIQNKERKTANQVPRGTIGKCPWTGLDLKSAICCYRQFWFYVDGTPDLHALITAERISTDSQPFDIKHRFIYVKSLHILGDGNDEM